MQNPLEILVRMTYRTSDFELEALPSSARFGIELLVGEMLSFIENRISSLHLHLSWLWASHPDLRIM
jgi:hypothetical protein